MTDRRDHDVLPDSPTDSLSDSLPQWSEDELALLRSADGDRPRAQSLPAALAALGIGGAIASTAAGVQGATLAGTAVAASVAAAGGKWVGTLAIAKWIALAAVSATVVTGAAVFVQRSATPERSPAPASRAPATAPKLAPARAPAPPPASAVSPPDLAPQTPSAGSPASLGPAAEPAPGSSRRAKRPSPAQPDISSELAALDAAMRTLRAGHATAALAALDRYDASFARRGRLHVEATALRIEALVRAGQRDKAAALAGELLARHPRSPYAARIRALID